MPRFLEESSTVHNTDAKARRKVIDQRRMEYRRAIESYTEQRMLQHELSDYPEIIAANYLAAARALGRQTVQPAG